MQSCQEPVACRKDIAIERKGQRAAAIAGSPLSRAIGRLLVLTLLLLWHPCRAADRFSYPARAAEQQRLVVYAATDRMAMEPLLRDFQTARSEVAIDYFDFNSNELFASVIAPPDGIPPDLVISSAMDLQVKLVNDGWTRSHVSHLTRRLPAWANWRDEAFGFTLEPAVIVYRRGQLDDQRAPRSHLDLIRELRDRPNFFRGRVATYDPAASGVGYLLATQDSVLSSQFWPLAAAFGAAQAQLYASSAELLDAVERGAAVIAYNVLGPYARARAEAGAPIEIVTPRDYTLLLSRVATIPKGAANPTLAKAFVDYLLSPPGRTVLAGASKIPPIRLRQNDGAARSTESDLAATGSDHPIALSPALLAFLDPMKRQRFLADWWLTMHAP